MESKRESFNLFAKLSKNSFKGYSKYNSLHKKIEDFFMIEFQQQKLQ